MFMLWLLKIEVRQLLILTNCCALLKTTRGPISYHLLTCYMCTYIYCGYQDFANIIMSQSVLQATPLPTDECDIANIALFDGDDECSMSARELFFNRDSTDNDIINLYNGDCPTRLLAYATACSESFGDSADEVNNMILSVVHIVCS